MNIYLFELKAQLKSFIIWALSMLLIYFMFMSGMFNVLLDSRGAVEKAISGFPPAFAAAFNLHLEKIFTFGGFYSFIFSYLAVVGAIMAVSMSVSVFAREKRSRCIDFLLAKPVSRERIFMIKLMVVLTLLAVMNILYIAVSVISYTGLNSDSSDIGNLIWASCAMFLTQLVFMAVGIIFAVYAKKVRSVSGAATAIGFSGFILSALQSLLEKEYIRYIAPLKYFEPSAVFETGGFEVKYALTAIVVIVVCVAASFFKYSRSDTPAL